jgi:integrase
MSRSSARRVCSSLSTMKTSSFAPIPQLDEWCPGFTDDKSKFRFLHQGHRFTLFKREGSLAWYVKFKHAGKQKMIGLGTADVKNAKAVAIAKWSDTVTGKAAQEEAKAKEAKGFATIGELIRCYKKRILLKKVLKQDSIDDAVADLRRLVREGLGLADNDAADAKRADVLTKDLVKAFQEARRRRVMGGTVQEQGRANLTMDSVLASARSLFTAQALECYEEETLKLPDLTSFIKARKMKGYHDLRYVPIPLAVMEEMEKDIQARRETEPMLYLAQRLMLRCGLRNDEVVAAEPCWIERLQVHSKDKGFQEVPVLAVITREHFTPKNRLDRRIPIPEDLMKDIAELVPAEAKHLIAMETVTDREAVVDRHLCNWVAKFLPSRQKKAYELRKHFGSVIAATQGIYKAQEYLGHKSVTTTERHYASCMAGMNSRPMQITELVPQKAAEIQ